MSAPIDGDEPRSGRPVMPSVWRVAALPAISVMLVLLCTASRDGFHGDELYFRMLPLAWWYDDQPPMTVWLAHAAAGISGDVWVQRVPGVVASGLGAVVAAAFPRLLGCDERVQRVAAWGHAFTVYPLLMGHVMVTATLDLLAWQLVALGVVAALCGRRHGLVWAGVVAGVACWNKLLVLAFVGALFLGLLCGARRVLRTREALVGAAALIGIGGFQVAAQLTHGLPMLDVSGDLVARHGTLNRLLVLPLLVVFLGPPLAPIWWRGLAWHPASSQGERGDAPVLAVTAGVVLVFSLVSPAQPYYAVAAFLPALAVGWGCAARADTPQWRRARTVVTANALVAAVMCLPLVPTGSWAFHALAAINPTMRDQVGWPDLARQMADAAHGEPIVTDSYALAGAATRFGGPHGLPREEIFSGHNALGSLGAPRARSVLVVGYDPALLRRTFARCDAVGTLRAHGSNPFDLDGTRLARCSEPIGGWATAWPKLRRLGG